MYTRTVQQSAFDGICTVWGMSQRMHHGVAYTQRNKTMDGVIPCKIFLQQKSKHVQHIGPEQIKIPPMLPIIRDVCRVSSRVVSER